MGYVGPVVTRHLVTHQPSWTLYGYDTGYFAHVLTEPSRLPETALRAQTFSDVRQITVDDLSDIDTVVHLAAISNDPMGNRYERVTEDINHRASVRVAELARDAGVRNFVFASSCSMYGSASGGARKEDDELNPLTAYARSKVATENALRAMDIGGMTVTCLRFATACGASPRLRLDLVLNDFVACALVSKQITVLSDGSPWRPLIDVEDMARAIRWAAAREPAEGGQRLSINVGRSANNYKVKDLAEAVAAAVAGTSVSINPDAPPDKRSYKVDFSMYEGLAPRQAQPAVSLDESISRLVDCIGKLGLVDGDFRNSQFMRLKVLEAHIANGRLDEALTWLNSDGSAHSRAA